VTIDELKLQLNLDHDLDDDLLIGKLAAAQVWVGNYIGTPLADLDSIPATINEAVLQLAAAWYEQREATSYGSSGEAVPFGVHDLLAGHRLWAAF
jgi:uncharacterized phage protein (predicted DNA packaging)